MNALAGPYGEQSTDFVKFAQLTKKVNGLQAENAKLRHVVETYNDAAAKFIEKVENGRARSVETYRELKTARSEALEAIKHE